MEKIRELSLLDSSICNIESLIYKEHHRDYQLWYDKNQRKEYCEYKLYGWPNQKQMQIYQLRKDEKDYLVYVHYLASIENSGFKQFSVFIQRIHLVLTGLTKISFAQGLYAIKNILSGFRILFQKFGYVHIDDKLIGLNGEGNIKVWLNQNFAYNGIATTHLAPKWMSQQMKQKQMIGAIFSIVQDRLQKNDRLRSFKKERQLKLISLTFQTALDFIEKYAMNHEIIIPSSIPELLRMAKNETNKIEFGRGSSNQKQFLSFKNNNNSPTYKKKKQKYNPGNLNHIDVRNYKNGLVGSPRGRRLYTLNDRFLSPHQDGIRARNRSEAGFSVASSRPRTTLTTRPVKPTKYFFCNKSVKPKIQVIQRQNVLISSQISRDFCFTQNAKNQVQVFNFNQNQKPSQSQKKRKYSAADKIILQGLSVTPKTKDEKNIALSLARSMVVKNKLEESRKLEKKIPEQEIIPISEASSPGKNSDQPFSPKTMNPQESQESNYKNVKPFLNYKSVNKSIINNHNKEQKKQVTTQPNLKNSFLKNMDMKNSQIIMQRSSEYASIHDIMKTIKESEIETPLSDKCFDTFGSGERNASLFVANVVQKKKSSDINISNSTTDRKSGLIQERKDGLGYINFSVPIKPKQLKEGMFKSIFVGESRENLIQGTDLE